MRVLLPYSEYYVSSMEMYSVFKHTYILKTYCKLLAVMWRFAEWSEMEAELVTVRK